MTMNEPFFVGHFPEEPVMPGVLIVEAMAQCSGIMVLSNVPDPENYSTYFMKIDGVKFKRKVVPGDTLQFEIHLLEPMNIFHHVIEKKQEDKLENVHFSIFYYYHDTLPEST